MLLQNFISIAFLKCGVPSLNTEGKSHKRELIQARKCSVRYNPYNVNNEQTTVVVQFSSTLFPRSMLFWRKLIRKKNWGQITSLDIE